MNTINEILPNIKFKKDELAEKFNMSGLPQVERDGLMQALHDMQKFEENGNKYKMLADNGLDMTEAADALKSLNNNTLHGGVSFLDDLESFGIQNLGKFYPSASETYRNGMNDFKDVENNNDVKVLDNYKQIGNKDIEDFFKNSGVDESKKGAIYNANTGISKRIADSPDLDKFVSENMVDLQKGAKKQYGIVFSHDGILDVAGTDNFAAFQHGTILNPEIGEDGVLRGWFADYYDFEERPVNGWDIDNRVNNHGYREQQSGNLKNQFYLIRFEKPIKH